MSTIADVAARAGVSKATASRALSGRGYVSEDTRNRVEDAARDLADGPTFAHGMTKTMLGQEWSMSIEQAIEAEAQAAFGNAGVYLEKFIDRPRHVEVVLRHLAHDHSRIINVVSLIAISIEKVCDLADRAVIVDQHTLSEIVGNARAFEDVCEAHVSPVCSCLRSSRTESSSISRACLRS